MSARLAGIEKKHAGIENEIGDKKTQIDNLQMEINNVKKMKIYEEERRKFKEDRKNKQDLLKKEITKLEDERKQLEKDMKKMLVEGENLKKQYDTLQQEQAAELKEQVNLAMRKREINMTLQEAAEKEAEQFGRDAWRKKVQQEGSEEATREAVEKEKKFKSFENWTDNEIIVEWDKLENEFNMSDEAKGQLYIEDKRKMLEKYWEGYYAEFKKS